jgi:AcrR family transcriptional regulator
MAPMTHYPEEPPIELRTTLRSSADRTPVRRLRSDALHNRHSLLAVAVSLLSRSDDEVSLEAIAREAGVGIGTLYRHFPTREALVVEAYSDEIDQLCTAVDRLLDTFPPHVALREWMQWLVDYVTVKRGMAGALGVAVDSGPGPLADTRHQLVTALDTLLRAGSEARTIRNDLDAQDVLFALRGIWMVPVSEQPDGGRRLLNLLVDGLRGGAQDASASRSSAAGPDPAGAAPSGDRSRRPGPGGIGRG